MIQFFPVEGKSQVKDEETEISYVIYAVDADYGGRDIDTDLAVEQVTVRIQEPKLEPLRYNAPCIKEALLGVLGIRDKWTSNAKDKG